MGASVTLLGSVAVMSSGPRGRRAEIRGKRARIAFALLVRARQSGVSEDQIADAIWPAQLPNTWRSSVRTALAQVRSVVRSFEDVGFRLEHRRPGWYVLHFPPDRHVDVEENAATAAHAEAALAAGRAQEAIRLAAAVVTATEAELLPDCDAEWVDSWRRELLRDRARALEALSTASLIRGDHRQALSAAERLIALDPYYDPGHALLLRAHGAAGERALAIEVYQRYLKMMEEELGAATSEVVEAARAMLDARSSASATPEVQPGALAPVGVPFVGRQRDLTAVTEMGRMAFQERSARLLVLQGATGSGKTRLATEAASRFVGDGVDVWSESCTTHPAYPYGPLLSWLRQIGGDGAALATRWSEVLRSGGATGARWSFFEEVAAMLHHGLSRPGVLFLDEIDQAATDCIELLAHIMTVGRATPLFVMATARPERSPARPGNPIDMLVRAPGYRELRVDSLNLVETSQLFLLASGSRRELSDDEIARVYDLTGGNPMMVLAAAKDDSWLRLYRSETGFDDVRSSSLFHAVDRYLGELSGETKAVLELAAVIGPSFEGTLLAAAAFNLGEVPAPAVREVLRMALVRGWVRVNEGTRDRYDFVPRAIQGWLREQLSAERLTRLHLAVGRALRALDPGRERLGEVAFHFTAAWPVCSAHEAASHARAAGVAALEELELHHADELFTTALDLLALEEDPASEDERAELLFLAGQARLQAGRVDASLPLLRAAVDLGALRPCASFAAIVTTYVEGAMHHRLPADAVELLHRAVKEARGQPVLQKDALYMLHLVDGDLGPRVEEEELDWASHHCSPAAYGQLLDGLCWWHFGHRRKEIADELCLLGERTGHPELVGMGLLRGWVSDVETGLAAFHDERAGRINSLVHAADLPGLTWCWALWQSLVATFGDGDLDRGRAQIEVARAVLWPVLPDSFLRRPALRETCHQLMTSAILRVAGDTDAARKALEPVLATPWWHGIDSRPRMALQYAEAGRHDAAFQLCQQVLADGLLRRQPNADWLVQTAHVADTYALLGDRLGVQTMIEVLEPHSRRHVFQGLADYFGSVHQHLGFLYASAGEKDAAVRQFDAAFEEHRRIGCHHYAEASLRELEQMGQPVR